MIRFAGVTQIILAVIVGVFGVLLIFLGGQAILGAFLLVVCISFTAKGFVELKAGNKNKASQKEQTVFLQNIDTVTDLTNPLPVIVRNKCSSKYNQLCVYLNGKKVGNIQFDAELKIAAGKERNLVKIGGLEEPFNYPESGCLIVATESQDTIKLEIVEETSFVVLKRV